MSENIGILSTPDNTGPSISITNNLKVENASGIRYDEGISINDGNIFLNDNCIWVGNGDYDYLAAVPKLDGTMTISGGPSQRYGGTIRLYGVNTQYHSGGVMFSVPNSELDNGYNMIRITDTEIRHNSKPIDSISEFGGSYTSQSYIKYNSGLLLTWQRVNIIKNGVTTLTLPHAYYSTGYTIQITRIAQNSTMTDFYGLFARNVTNTSLEIYNTGSLDTSCAVFTIGRWK